MNLLASQRALQSLVRSTSSLGCRDGRAVYRNAYVARLLEALESNFPIASTLQPDSFRAAARAYIDRHPSTFKSIRSIGAELPQTLRDQGEELLADVTAFEWVLAHAFDAADATPLRMDDLASIEPASWPALTFEFHPSMRCVELNSNAAEIARAHFAGTTNLELCAAPRSTWVVWRSGLTPKFRSLDLTETVALATALAGGSFETLCDSLCEMIDATEVPQRAASLLKTWVDAGLVVTHHPR